MSDHDRLIDTLRRVHEAHPLTTAEERAENLAQLIRTSLPDTDVPESLSRRVIELQAQRSPSGHRTPSPIKRRWSLAAVASAMATALLLASIGLLTINESAVETLAKTLSAMARVRSAHCSGWFYSYRSRSPSGHVIPCRIRQEWWYKSPARYRRDQGPEVRGCDIPASTMTTNGQRGVYTIRLRPRPLTLDMSPSTITRELSPIDFFSAEGIVDRARREKRARIRMTPGHYGKRKVRVVRIDYRASATSRDEWVLLVDPTSSLLLRAEYTNYGRSGSSWQMLSKDVIERFEYNVSVRDGLFRIRALRHPRGPSAANPSAAGRPRYPGTGLHPPPRPSQ